MHSVILSSPALHCSINESQQITDSAVSESWYMQITIGAKQVPGYPN